MQDPLGARHYCCGRCRLEVAICSACDRGNVSFGRECAEIVQRESNRKYGKRYRESPAGALCNARRQREFRKRQNAQNPAPVTQHPPHNPDSSSELSSVRVSGSSHAPFERVGVPGQRLTAPGYCCFCGMSVGAQRRSEFLSPTRRR